MVSGSSGSRLGSTSGCAGDWGWRPGATSAGLVLGEAIGAAVAELVTSRQQQAIPLADAEDYGDEFAAEEVPF